MTGIYWGWVNVVKPEDTGGKTIVGAKARRHCGRLPSFRRSRHAIILCPLGMGPGFRHTRLRCQRSRSPSRNYSHRGVALQAPENTVPAVQKAIELGCAMAEIDLRYTSDGEVILMHDGTLERTTNGSGRVSGTSLARVRQLDASARFPSGFAATKVPTLRETIELARGKIQLYLDLKEDNPVPAARLVKELGAHSMVVFRPYTLLALKQILSVDPQFRVLSIWETGCRPQA